VPGVSGVIEAGRLGSLLEIVEVAAERYPDRPVLALRSEGGPDVRWTTRELLRRSRLVAWRLRAIGLDRGDRVLTWSPGTPELPAVYFGAMRAGVAVVPIDLRMAPDTVERIAQSADARWLAVGTGRDAPDLRDSALAGMAARTVTWLTAEPGDAGAGAGEPADVDFPADWEAQVAGWPPPTRSNLFEIVYTSGTTGHPKGVMLSHGNILATVEATTELIPAWEHRVVSLLPLSHLFGQLELLYVIALGAELLYVRSRNPRVIFEAIRDHRVTTMVVVPQVLDLFWSALTREIEKRGQTKQFERARRIARRLPYRARRLIFRRVHAQLGGQLRLFISAAAFLPPAVQRAWEDLGIIVMQGYGATECGFATATRINDHPTGVVGKPTAGTKVRLADDGEVLVGGAGVFEGYWREPEATAAALDTDGWYHTGDVARWNDDGHLVLSGRTKNMIVLPNGLKVYPEDIENALRVAGLRDTIVVETSPGRIEAIVLAPDTPVGQPGTPLEPVARTAPESAALRARIDAAVKAANAALAIDQRIDAWRLWPYGDFPRTHTLKVKRDAVRAWLDADAERDATVATSAPRAAARSAR
jgi:long-chain acyl-CoA synthetase